MALVVSIVEFVLNTGHQCRYCMMLQFVHFICVETDKAIACDIASSLCLTHHLWKTSPDHHDATI